MPLSAPNKNQQIAQLGRTINAKKADGVVTAREAKQIVAQAKRGDVQGGELALLRNLARDPTLAPGARGGFVNTIDKLVPAGPPTAQLAAILLRVDPDTGRQQLLDLMHQARNPVPGGPTTFVVRGLGPPYLATITTAQVTLGLAKFLPGATPEQAHQIRHLLGQQLDTLSEPQSKGGVAAPGLTSQGLAMVDDTRVRGSLAINQNAVALHALEQVMKLPGGANAKLAARASGMAKRVAHELTAELNFAYPAKGRLAYSVGMSQGKPVELLPEDGGHLTTTLTALRSLQVYGKHFAPVVARIERRYPEIAFAGPEDISGVHGEIYSPGFQAFLAVAHPIERKSKITANDVARLQALAESDGVVSPGERGVIERLDARLASGG